MLALLWAIRATANGAIGWPLYRVVYCLLPPPTELHRLNTEDHAQKGFLLTHITQPAAVPARDVRYRTGRTGWLP